GDLVQHARQFFRSRLPDTSFRVIAFPELIAEAVRDQCGPDVAAKIASGSLDRRGSCDLTKRLEYRSASQLGPWNTHQEFLFEDFHAYLAGGSPRKNHSGTP